jgi:hypothetical protein
VQNLNGFCTLLVTLADIFQSDEYVRHKAYSCS